MAGAMAQQAQPARKAVADLLKRSFRPEFLNRLDETVFYKPLTQDNIRAVLELQLADLKKRLAEKQIGITLTDAAKDYIIQNGYDPVYGARPLKRFIQSRVETLAARIIISKDPEPGSVISVDCGPDGLTAELTKA